MGAIQIILLLLILCLVLVALGRLRRQTKDIEDLQRCLGRHPNMPPTVTTPKPVDYSAPQHDRPPRSTRHIPAATDTLAPQPVPAKAPSPYDSNQRPQRRPLTHAPNAPTAAEKWEKRLKLEQWIGTRGLLVLGIVATLLGTGFFLRYAYANQLIGPWGRVAITALAGALALGIGEWTRRRDYDIVARGLTALGFALLYAAVFSAYAFYDLLDPLPAFALSILVTAAAMVYSVLVDEILAAFIALLGGFLAPYLLSSGENQPLRLFSYVTLLTCGALACALVRKWRPVNYLAFIGTYGLYIGWYERFYSQLNHILPWPPQAAIALVWLAVFFAIFLVLPLLYELRLRVPTKRLDVMLILANATTAFAYFARILYLDHRKTLAGVACALALAHLLVRHLAARRQSGDTPLRLTLLAIALFFVTLAVPLYFGLYASAMVWAAQALILSLIALHYRSWCTRVASLAAFGLSILWLLRSLPLHHQQFTLVFNQPFLTWLWVVAAFYISHYFYRRTRTLPRSTADSLADILFGGAWCFFAATLLLEWHGHIHLNHYGPLQGHYAPFDKALIVVSALLILLAVVRPIAPFGLLWPALAAAMALPASLFLILRLPAFYQERFTIFFNPAFLMACLLVGSLLAAAPLIRRRTDLLRARSSLAIAFALMGTVLLWLVLTEQIYLFWHYVGLDTADASRARFLAHMYVSILWAVYAAGLMVIGFWKRTALCRYLALGLIALVILKVFLFDTKNIQSIYRVGGLVVLGLILVALSYLYQYGRKKGFFTDALARLTTKDDPS